MEDRPKVMLIRNYIKLAKPVIGLLLFMLLFTKDGMSQNGVIDLSCIRQDTLELHPLTDAESVSSFMVLADSLKKISVYATGKTLEHAFELASKYDLRDDRVRLAYQLLNFYSYEKDELTKQVVFATIINNDLDLLSDEKKSPALNLLGNTSSSAGDLISALTFYQRAYEIADSTKPLDKLYPLGNLSETYLSNGDTATALQLIRKSVNLTADLTSPEEIAYNNTYDYTSLGKTFLAKNALDSADLYLKKALKASHFFKSDHRRFEEVQTTLLPSVCRYHTTRKNSMQALAHIDSLYTLWPAHSNLLRAEHYKSSGSLEKALSLTETAIKRDLSLDKERLELRRDIAISIGQFEVANEASSILLEKERNTLAVTKKELLFVSKAQLEAFEKEHNTHEARYESQIETLQIQQRNWIAISLILFSLGIAIWFNQRYRKSQKRTVNLSKIVSRHEKDLIIANEKLASKVRSMERFNHLLSHDLREPLRSISGFTSILKRKAKPYEELKDDFDILSKSVDQLAYLMVGVERLRRVEEKKPEKSTLDLKKVLAEISKNIKAKYSDHAIEINTKGDLTPIRVDKDLVAQSLLEVVDNAAKFSYDRAAFITIEVVQEKDRVILYVQDEGIGINAEFGEQIFGIFKRLNRRENFIGSGVGLALAKLAVEKCSGSVMLLESQIGKGSTFQLSFPLVKRKKTLKQPMAAIEALEAES